MSVYIANLSLLPDQLERLDSVDGGPKEWFIENEKYNIEAISEFVTGVKTKLTTDSKIYLLFFEGENLKHIEIAQEPFNGQAMEYISVVGTQIRNLINLNKLSFGTEEAGEYLDAKYYVGFSEENADWDVDFAKLSGYTSMSSFYLWGYHNDFFDDQGGPLIVTQGYYEGDLDTGICCDNDADSYGGPDILPPGISVDMFNEEYFI